VPMVPPPPMLVIALTVFIGFWVALCCYLRVGADLRAEGRSVSVTVQASVVIVWVREIVELDSLVKEFECSLYGGSRLDSSEFACCNILPEELWSLETWSYALRRSTTSVIATIAVWVPGIGAFPRTPMRFSTPFGHTWFPLADWRREFGAQI